MKSKIAMIALAALAGSAMAQGQDGTVRFDSMSPYGGRNAGGEFNMSSVSGPVDLGSFITFCVELNENVAPGQTYSFDINSAAINGGQGGGNPDPLDAKTAALYDAFVSGSLDHYDYDNSGDGGQSGNLSRKLTAAALQAAIWELEDERAIENTDGNSNVRALANYYVDTLAQQLVDLGLGANVRILNMYASNGTAAQDMLVMIPLPQTGALACVGLAGLAIRRRRSS